jgi:hypothetical protein
VRNNIFGNSQLSAGMLIKSDNNLIIDNIYFSLIIGTSLQNSLLTIRNSKNSKVSNIRYENCDFNSLRAFYVDNSQILEIDNIKIAESVISNDHLIYLSDVYDMNLNNTYVSDIATKGTAVK